MTLLAPHFNAYCSEAIAFGLLWGACILTTRCASNYSGYRPGTGIGSVVTGTIYALLDGAIGGAIFAWLYNLFVARNAK